MNRRAAHTRLPPPVFRILDVFDYFLIVLSRPQGFIVNIHGFKRFKLHFHAGPFLSYFFRVSPIRKSGVLNSVYMASIMNNCAGRYGCVLFDSEPSQRIITIG